MPLCSSFFLLVALAAPAAGDSEVLQLKRVTAEPALSNKNLLPNPGFEKSDANGTPSGWTWDRRNTDATCTVDRSAAHRGKASIKLTNGTPFGAHVFGSLWLNRPIRLIEGKTYTMSAWVRSPSPGIVQLIGGGNWQHRAAVPTTGQSWRRIAQTFTAGPNDVDFTLHINTESPTSGAWIDDVKLEEGDSSTLDPPDAAQDSVALLEPETAEAIVEGDGPFRLTLLLLAPQTFAGTLEASVGAAEPCREAIRVPAGVWRVVAQGDARSVADDPRGFSARLVSEQRVVANVEMQARFYSPSRAVKRLDALRAAIPGLKKDLEGVRSQGQDVSYPRITYTVLDNFLGYVEDDIHHSAIQRAEEQLGDMEVMAARLGSQLKEALCGRRRFADVPRWTARRRPLAKDGSFIAEVRLPDGSTAKRPVFFNGYGHFGQVVADMEKWPDYGTNIIQIEFGPNSVFPAEDKVSDVPVKAMLATLDRAQKAGVAVCLLISPHYFPDWAKAKWPHLWKRREGFLNYCLHAPESQALLRRYVAIAIAPLKDHPALHSICLSNEPVNEEEPCEPAKKLWQAWLENRHGQVGRLNARYGTKYGSFAEVPLPSAAEADASRQRWMDFVRFNQEFFAGWHQMLADAVHAVAPDLPVHAKAMTWTMLNANDLRFGVDATLFGRLSQINGNDSVNFYDFNDGEFAQGWQLNAMALDLQRSVRNAPIFNTENHVIMDRETRYVPAEHIRAALWQAAVHGQGATTIWVWERSFDPKGDLFGSIMHRPACAEAVGRVNCDLNRAAREVTALQQSPPRLLILHSVTAGVWDRDLYGNCLDRLYTALSFTGLKIGFVTERQLESGEIPVAPVLFVPGIEHLTDAAAAGLRKFRGRTVFVGRQDLLTHDEYGAAANRTISADPVWFGPARVARDWYVPIMAELSQWNVRPDVELRDADGQPAWGVQWRTAPTPQGLIVNLCNYRKTPAVVELIRGGQHAAGEDVLSGQRSDGRLILAPLEVKLLRLK